MDNLINNFYDLKTWKIAHKLVLDIYKLTGNFPKNEFFGITNQLRRAVSSVTANIAEGFERYYFKDKIRFYYQARGSVAEVQNFLILSKDLGYIDVSDYDRLIKDADDIRQLINGMIRSINRNI